MALKSNDSEREYDIIKEIGSGDYGKVLLATHKRTNTQAVERTEGAGLLERNAKVIVEQLTKAIEFMHQKNLVHRDIRAENVLVFAPDFSKIKLTDFGLTRKAGTLVKKRTRSLPTCPPEIWETLHLEGYHVELGSDVWQLAMFIFIITQARFPWEKADITDLKFVEFIDWQKRKTTKLPREFTRFSTRILRLFRRLMEVKPNKRYPITEVNKYFKDQWVKTKVPRSPTMYLASKPYSQNLDVPSVMIKVCTGQPFLKREEKKSNKKNADMLLIFIILLFSKILICNADEIENVNLKE
ncbi:hypothetical protein RND71_043306 [Anisodus tanguticus]|uniref:Protein kinase domain-containing protein n=1 Tax=Anisodus tanguticus TaxID=243964 RepID=A0AAE1UNF6_9SOLA|nr:hypothetical protein RND71_043306 [Anisodus tanguticus]